MTLSILQSQFIDKRFKKTENYEQNVVLLLFLFTLDFIFPRGKFGSPYLIRHSSCREQRYPFLPVCAVSSSVQTMVWLPVCAVSSCVQTMVWLPVCAVSSCVQTMVWLPVCAVSSCVQTMVWLPVCAVSSCVQTMVWLPVCAVSSCVQTMVWLPVCAVSSCVQTMVWLPVFGIFNVRTDVDTCDCTRGLYGHRQKVGTGMLTLGEKSLAAPGLEPASLS